jgi:ketosteroid isomerase-like protein
VWVALAGVILIGVGLGGCAGTGGEDAAMTDAERTAVVEEAEEVIASLFEAMNAAEADAVLDYYSADPFIRVSCTQIQDRGLFMSATASYYRTRDSLTFQYQVTGSRALSSDAAVVSASGGLPEADGLFWTWVLEREDGELRVVHEHESWPDCPEPPRSTFHGGTRMEQGMGDAPGG